MPPELAYWRARCDELGWLPISGAQGPATPVGEGEPAQGGGKMLAGLSQRQKRTLAVAGVGVVLALIYLLSRSQGEAPPVDTSAVDPGLDGQEFASTSPQSYDFAADNSAYLGQISSQLQGQMANLGSGLSSRIGLLRAQIRRLENREQKEWRQERRRDRRRRHGGRRRPQGGRDRPRRRPRPRRRRFPDRNPTRR
jgi:hypothetical protein